MNSEKVVELQALDLPLPLMRNFSEEEFAGMVKNYNASKPVDLRTTLKRSFGVELSYEDVDLLEKRNCLSLGGMRFILNYLLYLKHLPGFSLLKIVVVMGRAYNEEND